MSYRFKNNYYEKEKCECGGTKRIKDHGTWVGYYCTSCKKGGSVQKKNHKRSVHNTEARREFLEENAQPKVSMDTFMENDEPMSLMEFCKIESGGLTGQALKEYVSRYYGLD